MSLHQKRVTITAVDLSKVSENCVVVVTWEDEEPATSELSLIRGILLRQKPELLHVPIVVLRKGQTLTVEQLPKQPAPEAQKETK